MSQLSDRGGVPVLDSARSQPLARNLAPRQALSAFIQTAWRSDPVRFVGHFLEMFFSMMVGMPVLGVISAALAPTFPVLRAPTVYSVLMVIFMTVPMVAWMRFRGHTWRQAGEMTAAMLAPSAVLQAVGVSGPVHMPAMLLGMLGIMLYRRDEYLHGHCHDVCHTDGGRA